ncbi:hypothetical protein OAH18_03130 [bacterium]|nr:hypothetical protein [bacterium]
MTKIEDRFGNQVQVDWNGVKIDKVKHTSALSGSTTNDVLTFTYTDDNITKVVDSAQREWIYDYTTIDTEKYLKSVTGPESLSTTDASLTTTHNYTWYGEDTADPEALEGLLKTVKAYGGVEEQYSYYRNRRFLSVSNAAEGATAPTSSFLYDQYRNATNVVDRLGQPVEFRYSPDGLLTAEVQPDGSRTQNEWDRTQRLLTSVTKTGMGTTDYEYDEFGNITSQTDPTGLVTTYTYETDPASNFHQPTLVNTDDPSTTGEEREVEFQYDDDGNVEKSWDALDNLWQFEYDDAGRLDNDINPRNIKRIYGYNAAGQQNSITYVSSTGNTTSSAGYNAIGRPDISTDESGVATNYTYDDFGRVLTKTTPDPYAGTSASLGALTTDYEYGDDGRLAKQTNPDGQTTKFEYDSYGRLDRRINQDGSFTEYEYDANGQLVEERDELGRPTRYVYDSLGRQSQILYPDGGNQILVYDTAGNVVQQINGLSVEIDYEYDISGRLILETDPFENTVEHEYDAYGNRTLTTDARSVQTHWKYDASDRLVRTVYDYTDLGNGTFTGERIDFNVYDENGNIRHAKSYDISNQSSVYNAVTFAALDPLAAEFKRSSEIQYDDRDRVKKTFDSANQESSRTYDDAGRLETETDVRGNTTTYLYDAGGLLHKTTLPAPQAGAAQPVATVWRDKVGRVIRQVDANGNATRTEYDSRGRVAATILPDGSTSTLQYDAANRPIVATDAVGQSAFSLYDEAGRTVATIGVVADNAS